MKIKYLLSVVIGLFLMANIVNGQTSTLKTPVAVGTGWTDANHDTVLIAGGLSTLLAGNFETVINGDTIQSGSGVGHGTRNNPNTVYLLSAGTIYLSQAGLTVTDSAGTLSIVGQVGSGLQKPVLLFNEYQGTQVTSWQINANLVIKNIQNESMDVQGKFLTNGEGDIFLSGAYHSVDIENSMFEFDNIALINAQSCPQGLKVYYRGNYFRDFWNGSQWWGGRPFYAKVAIDTLYFTNNTTTLTGLMSLQQQSLTQWAFIDHNTIIDNLKYPWLNPIYLDCFFTNNIFVNSNLGGDDSISIIRGKGQDPDGLRDGIIGVDTLDRRLISNIQEKYKTYKSSKDTGAWDIVTDLDGIAGLSKILFFAANNVIVSDSSTTFSNYWKGNPADGKGNHAKDSAASYLNWGGQVGPYGLINFPEVFINSRGVALAAKYNNIQIVGNKVYEYPTQHLAFKTSTLDTSQVNFWIQWNRAAYGDSARNPVTFVASAPITTPTFTKRITFGDCDPTTIPGPNGVEIKYTSATGGITAFTDLKENFAQSVEISTIDGLPVGSLIWGTTPYVEKTSLDKVMTAYYAATGVNSAPVAASAVTLTVGPNPVKDVTTISFDLPSQTKATLTVTNLSGKVVATLADANLEGAQTVTFDASGLANGIYILVLKTDQTVVVSKLIKQ